MKSKIIIKSISLSVILIIGIFFMLGSAYKHDLNEIVEESVIHQSEIDNLQASDKVIFNKLTVLEKLYKKEYIKLAKEHNDVPDNNFRDSVEKAEEINIKIDRNNRRLENVYRDKANIIEESKKSCFPKNTKVVMYDGSLKAIDTITVGDKVMIYDIAKDSIGTSSVNEKFIDTNNHMYILNNSIQATSYERFLTQDGWKRVHNLSKVDSIFNGNSFVSIDTIDKVKKDLTVYNLNINSTHNFFVSYNKDDKWFLIHNSGGGGGGK